MSKAQKKFKLKADQIKPLAEGFGACIATDRIVVDGKKVRFMYREEPENDLDSGWRFMAGDESDEYMDNPDNHGVYDVNSVANCDPDIIEHLECEVGVAFERVSEKEAFEEVDLDAIEEE